MNVSRSRTTKLSTTVLISSVLILASACGQEAEDAGETTETTDAETDASPVGTSSPETAAPSAEDFGLGAEVVSAAEDEGTVVHAATVLVPEVFEEIEAAFEERYPIDVQIENTRAGDAVERVRTESRAGQTLTYDTLALGAYFLEGLSREDLLADFRPNDFEDHALLEAESDDYFPLVSNLYGIGVNTAVVDEGERPSAWADLPTLNIGAPVLAHDPQVGSGGYIWFLTMLENPDFGEEYIRGIGDIPELQLGASIADNISQLVRGEVGVYFPMTTIDISNVKGTDVEFVSPTEGPVTTPIYSGILEEAQHPNAAQLWLSFLWSKEGQELLGQGAQAPVRDDASVADGRWDLNEAAPVSVVSNELFLDQLEATKEGLFSQYGIG